MPPKVSDAKNYVAIFTRYQIGILGSIGNIFPQHGASGPIAVPQIILRN